MKKFHPFLSLLCVGLACFVLFVSLQSANKDEAVEAVSFKQSKFYIQKEILPDHSLYPLFMIYDRIRLEMADPTQKMILQNAYAVRRIYYAQRLLQKNEAALALTTFSKALKYQDQALLAAMKLQNKPTNRSDEQTHALIEQVLRTATDNLNKAESSKASFLPEDQETLGNLIHETTLLRNELQTLFLNPESPQQAQN